MSGATVSEAEPMFNVGDRVFSHYVMDWGTIQSVVGKTYHNRRHGVTGDLLPDTTWYEVKMDNGGAVWLDDANGNWDLARIVPEQVACMYGYGLDPVGAP